jgi:hypothetical protein
MLFAARDYLEPKPSRFVTYFMQTYSSWLNLAERRFTEITNKWIWLEGRESVAQLEKAIKDYIRT